MEKAIIEEEIKMWLKNANNPSETDYGLLRVDAWPLCREYLDITSENLCAQCPIAKHTGNQICKDTPIETALSTWRDFYDYHNFKSDWYVDVSTVKSKCKEAASWLNDNF